MSMLYHALIVALWVGAQAAPQLEDSAPWGCPAGATTPGTPRTRAQQGPQPAPHTPRSPPKADRRDAGPAANVTVDPKLFRKRRFRSPRVLFSTQPPPMSGGRHSAEPAHSTHPHNRTMRAKRMAHPVLHRGEFSVCDSVSMWVGDKTTATDIKGKEVTVLGEVNINNNVFKQYFFETKCRDPKPVSSGCRGIDAKHWNSYCTTTHTFVKALTMEGKQAAWRFIRIDTACVCVLSRKSGRP